MPKHGKLYRNAAAGIERSRLYDLNEAADLVVKLKDRKSTRLNSVTRESRMPSSA